MMINHSTQAGRTMMEMIGVLCIMGVLSVGGIALYGKAMSYHRNNKCLEHITSILANLSKIKLRQGSFEGVNKTNNATLVKLNIMPEEVINKDSSGNVTFKHPYDGEIIVTTAKSYDSSAKINAHRDILVILKNIPKDACIYLAAKNWGTDNVGVLAGKGDAIKDPIKNYTKSQTPKEEIKTNYSAAYNQMMSVAGAANACDCEGVTCSFAVWNF